MTNPLAFTVVQWINVGSQLGGIGITIAVAIVPGYIVGRIILALGSLRKHYDDSVEIIEVSES